MQRRIRHRARTREAEAMTQRIADACGLLVPGLRVELAEET